MTSILLGSFTSFQGHQHLMSGSAQDNALAVKQAIAHGVLEPVLTVDNATGRAIDLDIRGTEEEIRARYPVIDTSEATISEVDTDVSRGRGRPKLGVVAREVTLLPRHWEWLATQPGGASVALRKLVEDARRHNVDKEQQRQAKDRAYYFMSAMAGDFPYFEEASRALFADDQATLQTLIADWPKDIAAHVLRLLSV